MRSVQLILLLVVVFIPTLAARTEPLLEVDVLKRGSSERVWAPRIVGRAPNNEAGVITLPDGSLRFIYTNIENNRVESISSLDGGLTWSAPKMEFQTPGTTGHACQVVLDRNGEIHVFFLNIRGRGKIGVEYFIDVFQATSTNGRTGWTRPEPVFANSYVGAIRGAILMTSGRLLVSFAEWVVNSPHEKQSGPHEIRVFYSDDNGKTWMPAKAGMTAPILADYNGSKYGGVEPAIIELGKGGDRGTAYANAAFTSEGNIFVTTGQGPARTRLLFNPKWLDEKSRVDNLEHGLEGWSVFKAFGPASGWWRDCVAGPKLIKSAGGSLDVGLLFTHPDTNEPDGAIWNFPAGSKGSIELRVMLRRGSYGGRISLNDRFFDPGDQNGEKNAMFTTLILEEGQPGEGIKLPASSWQVVRFDWNLARGECQVTLDGRKIDVLRAANQTGNGISYLRLGSTAKEIDSSGFLVSRVSAKVGTVGRQ
jgi:hypothetical protein